MISYAFLRLGKVFEELMDLYLQMMIQCVLQALIAVSVLSLPSILAVLLAGATHVRDLQGKVLVTGGSAYSRQVSRQG